MQGTKLQYSILVAKVTHAKILVTKCGYFGSEMWSVELKLQSILARIFPEKNHTCPLRYGEFTHCVFHSELLELGSPEVQSWHSRPVNNDAGHLLKLQRSACQGDPGQNPRRDNC